MRSPATAKSTSEAKDAAASPPGKRKGKNRGGSRDDATRAIEAALQLHSWSTARRLIQEEFVYAPADHWLWMNLSLTYYEERDYEKALLCSKRAVELQPRCPLALWHYAGSLYMSGEPEAAFAVWSLLRTMDLEEIAYDECGEGMDAALQLVNDVHYRIARYYQGRGDDAAAREAFEKYLHNRQHGVASIYDEATARAFLAGQQSP